jgi:sodium transport system permease protein
VNQRHLMQMLVVWRKELKDAFRDRRAIYSILFGALFGPVMVGFMMNRLADRQRQLEEVTIPVVGVEHAPVLMEWLGQQTGVTIRTWPADADKAVRDRSEEARPGTGLADAERAIRDRVEDVIVVIPDDYAKKFRASRPAEIKIVSDGSRQTSRPKVQRVRQLLQRYNAEIGTLRLVSRGVSPAIVSPLQLRDVEVSSAQQRAAQILNFIPLFIVLAAFTGGMQIATDSTAGERERGSLEPLLVNPAPRFVIAAGKWLAATVSAMLSVVITTSLCLAMLEFIPLQDLGVRFRIGAPQVAGMLAAVLPLCALATSLQSYLATFARSFKEAQSYMGFLIMVPMLPGMATIVYPIASQWWMFPIPILGQHVLLADTLGGKNPNALMFVMAAACALVISILLVRLTTALLRRERIIFGR